MSCLKKHELTRLGEQVGQPSFRQYRCILSARVAATLVNHGKHPFSFQIKQVFLSLLAAAAHREERDLSDLEAELMTNHKCHWIEKVANEKGKSTLSCWVYGLIKNEYYILLGGISDPQPTTCLDEPPR
ncbi:Allergen Asp f 7 [Fusarium oxysporum f. sp. albedinis]|nr:Uncharacterized protein HZ326_23427 [Fusarium oxysporum f. sp. albedinis]KAJ0138463.1 Allergen Asp f 7 [Fusarium oxysporum f. sp. albedinis]